MKKLKRILEYCGIWSEYQSAAMNLFLSITIIASLLFSIAILIYMIVCLVFGIDMPPGDPN